MIGIIPVDGDFAPMENGKFLLTYETQDDQMFIIHLIGLIGDRNSLLKEIEIAREDKDDL